MREIGARKNVLRPDRGDQDACPYIVIVVALPTPAACELGNLLGDPHQTVRIGTPVEAVEAGGIEPPSEDVQELAPTRLFRDLELAMHPRTDELMQGQPIYISDSHTIGKG